MTEHKVTMESTLKVLLEQKKYSTLKDILVTMNPSDVAELFEEIADERLPRLFRRSRSYPIHRLRAPLTERHSLS